MANLSSRAALFIGFCLLLPSLAPAQSIEQGRFGRALKVGTTYAAAEHNPVYIVTPLTVELWARVHGKFDASVLLANEPRNSRTHWELFTEKDTGRFAVGLPGFDPPQVVSQADIADDQWHHVAFVFDGTEVRLYVDGKQAAKQPAKRVKPYPDTGPLSFGYQLGVAPHPDTTIDEVRISRAAREIAALPTEPFKPDADTIGLWHFDEDAKAYERSGFSDSSATGNTARLKQVAEGVVNNGGFDNTVGGKTRWSDMDYGPFFSSTITPPLDKVNVTHKGISIRLGKEKKHFVTFDTELLRMSAAWEGEFIKLKAGREGLSGPPEMGGKPILRTPPLPGWVVGKQHMNKLVDPRASKVGPLPQEMGRYRGLYVHGDDVVLAYEVAGVSILECPRAIVRDGDVAFSRTFQVGPSDKDLTLLLCDAGPQVTFTGRSPGKPPGTIAVPDEVKRTGSGIVISLVDRPGPDGPSKLFQMSGDIPYVSLSLKPRAETVNFTVVIANLRADRFADFPKLSAAFDAKPPQALVAGGPARYSALTTKGILGDSKSPYTVDTLTAPDDNPYKSFLRFGGHDFFKNGDCAVCSVSGDVWVVSGIDDKLESLKWRRYATGLFQPLGLRIVDDKVYVLGRDQITRLHDLNADGEADFYENFNNDGLVTTAGHAYVTCLETDPAGNFYYIKCGDRTPHGGAVLRVSKDGSKLDVVATGVRNANGLGASPSGLLSFADNQGDWVPATRLDLITQPRQFLGYTPMSKTEKPPTDPGKPIVWMPQNVDNSAGGQVWVEGDKWGLPAGTMLHTSYGGASLLQVMPETVKLPGGGGGGAGEVTQAGVWRFPLTFSTGIMRGRFRPQDGQLYVSGLRGWQTAGTKDGALQRVRYTGKPVHAPAELHVHQNGIRIGFTNELDRETAADPESWSVLQWNYRWSSEYGSKHWSAKDPQKQGYDTLEVKKATLLADGKTVFLEIPGLQPVMQMRISCNIEAKDGTGIKTDVYNTVHALGEAFKP